MAIMDSIKGEFKTRNFSIYGQWTGILCIILCFALGIANIFHFNVGLIIFSILLLVSGFLIIFLEIPILLRICPTSPKFDEVMRRFGSNWGRCGFYYTLGTIQFISLVVYATSLIAAAVVLLIAGTFYALAALKKQDFMGSKTLGGAGVAQMIV